MNNNYHQTGEKLTFWQLINRYKIEIPIMQRDYAQGRKEHKEIRESFLTNIYKAINNNEKLNLDFIYGSVEEDTKEKKLILIDGQQRITTLFLLHWYLVNKDNKVSDDVKSTLKRFTYETRISSREFIEKIIDRGIDFEQLQKFSELSEYIKDQPWFFIYWQRDPTIKAMLTMLDSIHEKFKGAGQFFEKLIQSNDPPITFYFLQLENFGLTDELYIKMNARGKLLTEFENFKARFENFLVKLIEFKINGKPVKDHFSQKIDGGWIDLFWQFRDKNNSIDTAFMNYFWFITEMLYYERNKEPLEYQRDSGRPQVSFEKVEEIYKSKTNLEFLFKSLDKWLEIANGNVNKVHKEIKKFFEGIFPKDSYQEGKVALFDSNVNLFEKCINNKKFDIFQKIVFFTILKYLIKFDKSEVDENLKDLIRVVRNLLLTVRQFNKTQIRYDSNLRYENLSEYLQCIVENFIDESNIYDKLKTLGEELSGFPQKALKHEREKAEIITSNPKLKEVIFKLEDHPLLKGMLFNLNFENNRDKLKDMAEELYKIWPPKKNDNLNNSLIIRAMLTFGDYAIQAGSTNLGNKYFFGKNEKWEVVLTNKENPNVLDKLLLKLVESKGDVETKLNEIIDRWLTDNQNKKNWFYYFMKYPEMTENFEGFEKDRDRNVYAWENDFEIEKMGGANLIAPHINPYVYTVIKKLNGEKIDIDNCYANYSDKSKISLKNGIKIYCMKEGWKIESEDLNETKENSLIKKFNLIKCENGYLLRILKESSENKTKEDKTDRIEVAINFIKSLS